MHFCLKIHYLIYIVDSLALNMTNSILIHTLKNLINICSPKDLLYLGTLDSNSMWILNNESPDEKYKSEKNETLHIPWEGHLFII
jgi:hypothetical protein